MNFGMGEPPEEPEINFIPLIDLLLVILIFLMVTTTYNQMHGISLRLPRADAPASTLNDGDIQLTIAGQSWRMRGQNYERAEDLLAALNALPERENARVIINADADTRYQILVDTMRLAQSAGFNNITMRTQTANPAR